MTHAFVFSVAALLVAQGQSCIPEVTAASPYNAACSPWIEERKCCPGLSCQSLIGCYPNPRQNGQPCSLSVPCTGDRCCGAGLICVDAPVTRTLTNVGICASTEAPTSFPSVGPTLSPTFHPSLIPSKAPSDKPTAVPTSRPSLRPSSSPTKSPTNIAMGKTVSQSSICSGGVPQRANDGNTFPLFSGGSVSLTCHDDPSPPWWQVLLGTGSIVQKVIVYNRMDCCSEDLSAAKVEILDNDGKIVATQTIGDARNVASVTMEFENVEAKSLLVSKSMPGILSLAEVEVMGYVATQRPTVAPTFLRGNITDVGDEPP